jgi:hypothetical protein
LQNSNRFRSIVSRCRVTQPDFTSGRYVWRRCRAITRQSCSAKRRFLNVHPSSSPEYAPSIRITSGPLQRSTCRSRFIALAAERAGIDAAGDDSYRATVAGRSHLSRWLGGAARAARLRRCVALAERAPDERQNQIRLGWLEASSAALTYAVISTRLPSGSRTRQEPPDRARS